MARSKGLPTIRERKDRKNLWQAQVNLGYDPGTGKYRRKTIFGRTQEECRQKLIKALAEIQQGTFVYDDSTKLSDWLDTWLEEYKKGKIRPTTYANYESIIRVHIKAKLGQAKLKDLTPDMLQKFYNGKLKEGLSVRNVKYIHTVLHQSLKRAVKSGLVIRNAAEATELPSYDPGEARVLSIEEQNKFINILEIDRLGIAFLLDLYTGLRRGELLGLTWKDIDFNKGILKVRQSLLRVNKDGIDRDNILAMFDESKDTKTVLVLQKPKTKKGTRIIPLGDTIIKRLRQHKAKQNEEKLKAGGLVEDGGLYSDYGLVFCTSLGGPIEPRNFGRTFYNLIEKAGLEDVNLHALRHTFATRLLESGEHPKVVQELLGHSSITMTLDIYSHVMPDIKEKAIKKLDSIYEQKETPANEGMHK